MRVAAPIWNDATRYGPHCDLFFFLMKQELGGKLGGAVPARSTRTEPITQAVIGRLCFLEATWFIKCVLASAKCGSILQGGSFCDFVCAFGSRPRAHHDLTLFSRCGVIQ